MQQKRCIPQAGFTLIELMVVIVIIGILVAIALPNFIGAQDRAKMSSVKANGKVLQTIVETYAIDWGGNYPDSIPAIRDHDSYKVFANPFNSKQGLADAGGNGAWRTNNDGDASGSDTALTLTYNASDAALSQGLVLYVGLDAENEATTRFLGDGDNGNPDITKSYMIYGCDKRGYPIRRFVLSPGNLTPAGQRLLNGN